MCFYDNEECLGGGIIKEVRKIMPNYGICKYTITLHLTFDYEVLK